MKEALLYQRENNKKVEMDYLNRSVKAQMKYANKIGAKFVIVIGDDEIAKNEVKIKNMETGNEEIVELDCFKILGKL